MLIKILGVLLIGYTLMGLLYSALAFNMTKKSAIEEGYVVNIDFIVKYVIATTLQWPVLIRFFIWPGNCWIEWKDENGKKHWTRDKEEKER